MRLLHRQRQTPERHHPLGLRPSNIKAGWVGTLAATCASRAGSRRQSACCANVAALRPLQGGHATRWRHHPIRPGAAPRQGSSRRTCTGLPVRQVGGFEGGGPEAPDSRHSRAVRQLPGCERRGGASNDSRPTHRAALEDIRCHRGGTGLISARTAPTDRVGRP